MNRAQKMIKMAVKSDRGQNESPVASSSSPRKRGRLANPASWKKNVRKQNRNEGVEYTTIKGKTVAARSIKQLGVDCPGKMKCLSKISHEARKVLFDSFWAMGNLQRQRDYLSTMVKAEPIKHKRAEGSMKRKNTMNYNFIYDDTMHRVCKPFFLNTLSITYDVIKTVMEKCDRSQTNIQSPDKRGHHTPSTKLSEDVVQYARAHIDKKDYLQATTNKKQMYKFYLEDCEEDGKRPVSQTFYDNLHKEMRTQKGVPAAINFE